MTVLSVENLHVYRGEQHVLRGLQWRLEAGCCLQITGENGAGKTTLLRVLCGLLPAESLVLQWCGVDCSPNDPAYHQELVYLSHAAPLKADLTGLENLRFFLGLRGCWHPAVVTQVLEQVGAARFADRPVRSLSAGQKRRLALAALAASRSRLWLMDEPTTHLDSAGVATLRSLLEQHLQAGGLAVVATHQDLSLSVGRSNELRIVGGRAT